MKLMKVILAVGIAGICFSVVSSALLFKAASTVGGLRPNAPLYGIAIANLLLAFAILAILIAVYCTTTEEGFFRIEEKETETRAHSEVSKGLERTILSKEVHEPAKYEKPALLSPQPSTSPETFEKSVVVHKPALDDKAVPYDKLFTDDKPAPLVKPTPNGKPVPYEKMFPDDKPASDDKLVPYDKLDLSEEHQLTDCLATWDGVSVANLLIVLKIDNLCRIDESTA